MEEAQVLGTLQRYALGVGQMGERLRQPLRILGGQLEMRPDLRARFPLRQGLRLQAGFDGQQPQASGLRGVGEQFHRAHGGAPGSGGQDALAVSAEKDGVDQLGLAARELGNEGQGHAVVVEPVDLPLQQRPCLFEIESALFEPSQQRLDAL